jgi:hypothetical protein
MIARSFYIRNVIAALLLPFLLVACDDDGGLRGTISVSSLTTAPSTVISATIVPTTLSFHILPIFGGCPSASPFSSNFGLFIDQRGGADLSLHQVGFQFVDFSGFGSPVTFLRHDLVTLFGSTLVAGGTSRTFGFQPHFGCGFVSAPHSMAAHLVLLDRIGTRHERRLTVPLR